MGASETALEKMVGKAPIGGEVMSELALEHGEKSAIIQASPNCSVSALLTRWTG